MADHIAVGEVAHIQAAAALVHAGHELVLDLHSAHLRDEVVGRVLLRGGYEHALLALVLLLHAAIQEEGDVRVFLRLGHAELLYAEAGDVLAYRAVQVLGRESDGQGERRVVLRGADVGELQLLAACRPGGSR